MIFKDLNSEFQIIDFSATHSQLLMRSMKNKGREYNIDIIFKGVKTVLCPTTLQGIQISIAKDSDVIRLSESFAIELIYDDRLFEIKDASGQSYFMVAMCFGIYHNTLEILETSIGRYYMGDRGEMTLWYSD